MKNILIFFVIVLLIQSCRKEGSTTPTGEYKTADLEVLDPPIMFTNNKMIIDSGIVNSYIRRIGMDLFMDIRSSYVPNYDTININFVAPDHAVMKFRWKTITADILNNPSGQLTLKARDTTLSYVLDENESVGFRLLLNLFHPYIHDNVFMVPMPPNGVGLAALFLQEYQLERKSGQLYLPQVKIVSKGKSQFANGHYFQYTRKNTDISKYLGLYDTVVIQYSRVSLLKVK